MVQDHLSLGREDAIECLAAGLMHAVKHNVTHVNVKVSKSLPDDLKYNPCLHKLVPPFVRQSAADSLHCLRRRESRERTYEAVVGGISVEGRGEGRRGRETRG